jgi:nifR3 family TIM-barrel protein
MANFWEKISQNKKTARRGGDGVFFCLAPMINVTDTAFRQIIAKYSRHGLAGGGPAVFWTEFVSADGLASEAGRDAMLKLLKFSKKEKPLVAQIFGAHPDKIQKACEIISKLGFDGIDINMGCPDKDVVKQGAGAALIKTPALAREIIRAAHLGAPKLPISVKTRIGYNTIEYKTWLVEILQEDIAALTVHLRTKKEMSDVPAHWELAKDIVRTARKQKKDIVLIANGDIVTLTDGKEKAVKARFDGIMIGRGIFGNPWLFDTRKKKLPTPKEKLKALVEHTKLYEKLLSYRNFANMKKHFKAYVSGWEGAKDLRIELMNTNNGKDVEKVIREYLKKK